jgi:hypothetical protein
MTALLVAPAGAAGVLARYLIITVVGGVACAAAGYALGRAIA